MREMYRKRYVERAWSVSYSFKEFCYEKEQRNQMVVGEKCGVKEGFFNTGIITACFCAGGNDSTVTEI